jgi:hypothetical protein
MKGRFFNALAENDVHLRRVFPDIAHALRDHCVGKVFDLHRALRSSARGPHAIHRMEKAISSVT